MKSILFLMLVVILQGCISKKHVNSEAPLLRAYSCPISEDMCEYQIKGLDVKYIVLKNDQEYTIRGRANWDDTDVSIEIVEIDRLDLFFAFFGPENVVHEQRERIRGERGEYISFAFKFSSKKDIIASVLTEYSYRITE